MSVNEAEFNHPVLASLDDELDRHRDALLGYLEAARSERRPISQ